MIEPEYVDEERLQLIQNYDYPDDTSTKIRKKLLSTTPLLSKMRCQLDDQYQTPAID